MLMAASSATLVSSPAWLSLLYAGLLLLLSPVSLVLVLVLLPALEVPQMIPFYFMRTMASFPTESI